MTNEALVAKRRCLVRPPINESKKTVHQVICNDRIYSPWRQKFAESRDERRHISKPTVLLPNCAIICGSNESLQASFINLPAIKLFSCMLFGHALFARG